MAARAKRLGLLDLSLDGIDVTGRGVSSTTSPKNGSDGGSMKYSGSLKILRHNASFKNLELEPAVVPSPKHVEQSRADIQALTMKKRGSGGSLRNLFGSLRGKATPAECSAVSRGSVARPTSGRDLQHQSLKSIRRMSAGNLEGIRPDLASELIKQAQKSRADVRILQSRVKNRRLSAIGFEEISVGDLVLGEEIGGGATAVVYEGTWNSISVAIKVFKEFPGGAYDPGSAFGRDLFQELTMLHNVGNHPNIVNFFGAVTKSEPRIVLELVAGPTLEGYLHGEIIPGQQANVLRNKLPIETIAGWTRDLLGGINFMHDRDPCIIHRDLKPANLVLVPDLSQLKILDFGIGKMVSSEDKFTASMSMQSGTCRYMAPEVFNLKVRSNYTEKADIYSASLVIWQITTGVRPFDNVNPYDFFDPEKREKIRPYVESMTQWPELRDLVESAWDLEPENRPSAKEMLLMLSETPRCPPRSAPVSPLLYSVQTDAMAMSKTCFDCSIC